MREPGGVPGCWPALDDLGTDSSFRQAWARLGDQGAVRDVYDAAAAAGAGLLLRPDHLRALIREVDTVCSSGVTLATCVHLATALPLLAEGAGGSQPAADLLAAAQAGRATVALAATDTAASGSDLADLQTQVRTGPDGLVVDGGKRWITNAVGADAFLTLARHRSGRHFSNFTWVLVPADASGVAVEPADTALFAGAGIGHVSLESVRLPVSSVVGRPGRAMPMFARHITRERFIGAVWAAALLRRVVERTQRLLADRQSDGVALWSNPSLRHRVGAAIVEVGMLDALTRHVQERVLTGFDGPAAAMVKAAAARAADTVLGICAGLQGADGYQPGGAQLLRAEAGVFGIGGGTVDLMLDSVAHDAHHLLSGMAS